MQRTEVSFDRRPTVSRAAESASKPDWVRYSVLGALSLLMVVAFRIALHHTPHRTLSPPDVATSAPTVPGNPADIPALAGIPNVSLAYYDVDATDAAGIREQIDARGPVFRGEHFGALTRWNYHWRWGAAPDGGCGTASAEISFEARLILPRLTRLKALKPELAKAWLTYSDALARHEANHARQAYGGRGWVAHEVRTASCADANAAGERAVAALQRQSDEYDASTRHGALEGAAFRAS